MKVSHKLVHSHSNLISKKRVMAFPVRLILLSLISPIVIFSALFLLYLLFFLFTVCIYCCRFAFNRCYKQRAATPHSTSNSVTTHTELAPLLPSSSSSSSSPSGKLTYDVFLSFRGEDTRTNFTDHLYNALKQKGIHTFRDDEELERGETIAPNLLKAIEESRYVIAVFSPNYAGSAWCLDEITHVAKCMKEMGQKVLPVFYHVDPSEVRRQTGEHFGKAFEKHQKRYKREPEKVKRWRDALFRVANLSGWHLQHGSEAKIIKEIVEKVFTELNKIISTSDGLVGMDSHMNELLSYLDIGCPDVRVIGICGMGGIGKTTIAQMVFQKLKSRFEGDSFLDNVKQGSIVHLQEKLLLNLLNSSVSVQNTKMGKDIIKHRLSSKRVLIVLDDVDQDKQMETLCHRTWFGPGSRIIITARDEHLISAFGADKIYNVKALSDPEALELFCSKAFKEGKVEEDFLKLSKEFLKYADGLPLAIEVLGSAVRGRSLTLWSSELKRLKKNPPKDIINVLRVSFDGLEETEKKIFLDIVCFFKGQNKDRVIGILSGCDDEGMEMDVQVLMDKALLTLFGTKLWMHDLIQEMGWEVVLQESREEPEKRSRLWLPNEIIRLLGGSNKVTSAVQSIFLQCATEDNAVHSINNAFSHMDRLRLLKISNVKFSGNIRYISNELQYLEWHKCPLDSFPPDFQPEKLVEIHMHFSRIKQLWKGKKGWRMLRHLDLSDSQYLKSTPDFTEVPDLEELVLENCTSLVDIHPSLGFLKKLCNLNLKNCKSIESLPLFTTLESLQMLRLSFCSRLKKFPKIKGKMNRLKELHLNGTSIEELPASVERLTGLSMLHVTGCKNLLCLPNAIGCLSSLKSLYLAGCSKIDELPESLNGMKCLKQLFIGGTSIRELSFIVGMKNLRYLSCHGCKCLVPESFKGLASSSLIGLDLSYCNLMDGEILNDLSSLISLLLLDLSGNCFVRLPENISQLSELENLDLRNCRELQLLPKNLPLSLRSMHTEGCTSLTDYPKQNIVLNSSESGATTIVNSSAFEDSESIRGLVFPRNEGESIQLHLRRKNTEGEQVDDYLPLTTLALEKESKMDFFSRSSGISATDEIPEWFSTISTRNPVSIPIPQNLVDDNKWKGVAACALVAVKGHTALSLVELDPEFPNHLYQVTFETDVVRLKPFRMLKVQLVDGSPSSHLLMFFYMPCFNFPEWELNQSTVVRAIFETTNPSMVVQKCGIRLVYEQDADVFDRNGPICLHEDGPVSLNEVTSTISVSKAGWINQSSKWEKFIPQLEEESEVVLRKNLESVLPRYLEAIKSCVEFKFNLRGSPAWFRTFSFGTGTCRAKMSIDDLPQNLHKNKKWMGFAIFLSLVEEVGQTVKQDSYQVSVKLNIGVEIDTVVRLVLEHVRPLREEVHQVLVIYVPRAQISEVLFTHQTSTTAVGFCIEIKDSPHVKVQRSGFCNVNQEDIQGLADTIIRCMQRANSLKNYDKWVEERMKLTRWPEPVPRTPREKYFDLHSPKYRNWDWSKPRTVYCVFGGAEISKLKWFIPFIKLGKSAEIRLPLNVFDDGNWLGFALCFQISTHGQNPNISLGSSTTLDSRNAMLYYRLDSDVAWHGLFDFQMHQDIKVLEPSDYHATRFLYIPRTEVLSKIWRQCKLARITMWFSSPCLAVDSCALRLLYKDDVEHLVQTLTLAELP